MNFLYRNVGRQVLLTAISLILIQTTGNATSRNDRLVSKLDRDGTGRVRILVMQPNIQIFKKDFSNDVEHDGLRAPLAKENFINALTAELSKLNIEPVFIDKNTQTIAKVEAYQRLQWAVSESIVEMHLKGKRLKTKGETMAWTLGPGVSFLSEDYDANYALFTSYLDVNPSALKTPLILTGLTVFWPALLFAGDSEGIEQGLASLVDLRTGDTIWLNEIPLGHGELTGDQKSVKKTIDELFINFPK